MTLWSRRAFLRGAAASGGSILLPIPSLTADPVTVGMAALTLASAILGASKASGALSKELEAINLKIDQVIANQVAILDALSTMEKHLDEIQKAVSDVPSETIGLDLVVQCGRVSNSMALAIKNLDARPQEDRAKQIYLNTRDDLFDAVTSLYVAVQASNRPSSLVLAACHSLDAIALVQKHEATAGAASVTDAVRLRDMARYILAIMQAMSGPYGVATRLTTVRDKITETTQTISSLTLKSILPAEFWKSEQATSAGLSQEVGRPALCAYDTTRAPPYKRLDRAKITFVLTRQIAFGGRPLYAISSDKGWETSHWDDLLIMMAPVAAGPTGPDQRVAGCVKMLIRNGVPVEYLNLVKLLDVYDSLAAVESRLIYLQDLGTTGRVRAQGVYDVLQQQ